MRRFFAFAMAFILVMSMSACAESQSAPPAGDDAAQVDQQSVAQIDLADASLDELYELLERVTARIYELEGEVPVAYESGTYVVGKDIPAGIYLIKEQEFGIFPSVTVRGSASADAPVEGYELIINHAVMQLSMGSYVTMVDVVAYPFDTAPEISLVDGVGQEGGYWVGLQIPAGNYRISVSERAPLSNYNLYSGVLGTQASLLKFEIVYDYVDVFLESGQYISLSGCAISALD